MAAFLDVTLVQYFDVVFPVLFVFALVFALLQKTKIIGDAMGINAIIAVVAGFTILLSRTIIEMINFMIPWFTVMIIFFFLMILIFRVFGAKEETIASALKDKTLLWTIIGVGLLIIMAAFGQVLGQTVLNKGQGELTTTTTMTESGVATSSFEQNIFATIFHPKVLGLLILFAIAVSAIIFLSAGP